MRVAPASREFSSSSLSTDAGRSTTSPAAILLATCSGSTCMRPIFYYEHRVRGIPMVLIPSASVRGIPMVNGSSTCREGFNHKGHKGRQSCGATVHHIVCSAAADRNKRCVSEKVRESSSHMKPSAHPGLLKGPAKL